MGPGILGAICFFAPKIPGPKRAIFYKCEKKGGFMFKELLKKSEDGKDKKKQIENIIIFIII